MRFKGHPFKVLDDEDMDNLTESIKAQGIISPLIVRNFHFVGKGFFAWEQPFTVQVAVYNRNHRFAAVKGIN